MDDGVPRIEYRTFPLTCECGRVPKRILAVGLSATHDLVIHWRCPWCRKHMYLVRSLSDCWRDCFYETPADRANSKVPKDTTDDRRFLHSIGVRFPAE
jgi:hypothetical protein